MAHDPKSPLPTPPPGPRRVHLVLADGSLHGAERTRGVPRGDRRMRRRRQITRAVLADYLGTTPDIERSGKPALRPGMPDRVAFNVSDSGDLVGVAIASAEVGLDIEAVRRDRDFERLIQRCLAPDERAQLEAVTTTAGTPESARNLGFLRCWTRKEALVKGLGTGVTMPLNTIVVGLGVGDDPVMSVAGVRVEGWSLTSVEIGPGHVGAVALEGALDTVEVRRLRADP